MSIGRGPGQPKETSQIDCELEGGRVLREKSLINSPLQNTINTMC